MNFGSKLLLIALTTMHLHTEVNKSLFLPLPLPLFIKTVYLPLSIDQTFTLNNSTLITTIFGLCCNILHDNIHTDRLLNTILLPMYQEMILKETIFHHFLFLFQSKQKWLTSHKKCEYWSLMCRVYRGTIFNKL